MFGELLTYRSLPKQINPPCYHLGLEWSWPIITSWYRNPHHITGTLWGKSTYVFFAVCRKRIFQLVPCVMGDLSWNCWTKSRVGYLKLHDVHVTPLQCEPQTMVADREDMDFCTATCCSGGNYWEYPDGLSFNSVLSSNRGCNSGRHNLWHFTNSLWCWWHAANSDMRLDMAIWVTILCCFDHRAKAIIMYHTMFIDVFSRQ